MRVITTIPRILRSSSSLVATASESSCPEATLPVSSMTLAPRSSDGIGLHNSILSARKIGKLSLALISALALVWPFQVTAVDAASSSLLENSPNLSFERDLIQQHQELVKRYNENYDKLDISRQPANKTEACIVSSDLFDGLMQPNTLLFWEGSCQNGKAEGFGRVYLVTSGRKTFEMLANFHSDEPQFTTTYYSKNTSVDAQTTYFYGIATTAAVSLSRRATSTPTSRWQCRPLIRSTSSPIKKRLALSTPIPSTLRTLATTPTTYTISTTLPTTASLCLINCKTTPANTH